MKILKTPFISLVLGVINIFTIILFVVLIPCYYSFYYKVAMSFFFTVTLVLNIYKKITIAKSWKNAINFRLFLAVVEGCASFKSLLHSIWFQFIYDNFRRNKHKINSHVPSASIYDFLGINTYF